jgi:hypothetical protein
MLQSSVHKKVYEQATRFKRQTRTRNGRQQDSRTHVGVPQSDRNKKATDCGHMTSLLPLCGVKQGRDCPQPRLVQCRPPPR